MDKIDEDLGLFIGGNRPVVFVNRKQGTRYGIKAVGEIMGSVELETFGRICCKISSRD